jgi:hypothetical protein
MKVRQRTRHNVNCGDTSEAGAAEYPGAKNEFIALLPVHENDSYAQKLMKRKWAKKSQ